MLLNEAKWIGGTICNLSSTINKLTLLNIGSSTKLFREETQPFINSEIFEPFKKNGGFVIHSDIKDEIGVDLVGDLYDNSFRESLKLKKIDIILCSNLLEHLVNPKIVCDLLSEIVPLKGFIIVTVPYIFPYHNDPIDTYFRPNPNELFSYFDKNKFIMIEGRITKEENSMINSPKSLIIQLIKTLMPFYKSNQWRMVINDYKIITKNFQSTCILIQKISN